MALELIIDTNAYSSFFRNNSTVTELMERADRLLIPAVVLGELFAGFNCGNRREMNYAEFNHFISFPGISIIPAERGDAEMYGHLVEKLKKAGTPIPTNDVWIAAAALHRGLSLLTNDIHFDCITGLKVVNF
jgi:tRNA(fMet)-specific endonuclease VapC